jgi:hypothetical protein
VCVCVCVLACRHMCQLTRFELVSAVCGKVCIAVEFSTVIKCHDIEQQL